MRQPHAQGHRVAEHEVHGHVDERFRGVRDAFRTNLAVHDELGGAVCVIIGGRVVADLWGGHRDLARTREWEHDTLVDVFSVGKGFLAAAVAQLVGEGALSYDEPVAARWPAFGAEDKGAVTLRQLLSHTAGLPAIRRPLPDDAVYEPATIRAALAAERPWWKPGAAVGYHVNTFGFLVGALVEQATRRSVGAYLRDALCGPIGADCHLGLASSDLDRVAEFRWPMAPPVDGGAALTGDARMRFNAYFNPPSFSGAGVVNTERWRRAEHPSTNMHATARGVARLYEMLAAGGVVDGRRVVDAGVLAEATAEASRGDDVVLERPSRFGLGFQLTMPERPIGRSPRGFGHFGAGGSLGFCDPDAALAFGYVTSDMGPRWQNPRNRGLTDAVFAALERP